MAMQKLATPGNYLHKCPLRPKYIEKRACNKHGCMSRNPDLQNRGERGVGDEVVKWQPWAHLAGCIRIL